MQKVFMLEPGYRGEFSTTLLDVELRDGWRVINAIPILKNIQQVSATSKIIYILEKEDED